MLLRNRFAGLLWLAAAGLALAPAGAKPPRPKGKELVLTPATGYIVVAEVNGRPLRLQVDPGATAAVLLNATAATAAGLKNAGETVLAVGPLRFAGHTGTASIMVEGKTSKLDVMWFDQDIVAGADGAINPADLPWDSIRFQLRPKGQGETELVYPMSYDIERGLYYSLLLGGAQLLTRFTLRDPYTTGTAATASVIARKLGGAWAGPVFTHPVRFNISRPVRPMALRQPLSVKGLNLSTLVVRISDDQGDYRLPSEELELNPPPDQQEAIVVRGKRPPRTFGPAAFWLMVGRGDLEPCSSLVYHSKPRRLVLSCAPAVAPGAAVPATAPPT